jgi:CheY-like chemotaxis protein
MKAMEDILKGKNILIADDDPRNTYALCCYLEASGFDIRIHKAGGGEEAIALLKEHDDIQLVLMDMMMPDIDGYEAIRRIRSDARTSEIPIIAVTAQAMKGDREKCLEAGATDYIAKPVDMAALFNIMAVVLNPR